MNEHRQKLQKEPYEKPNMVTEKIEFDVLAYRAGSPCGPEPPGPGQALVGMAQPFFGLCCG
jgi:hypothetical protein